MADIRINALPTTASASSSDDYIALDGTTNGTRKLNAYSPTFGGNLTVSGTGTSTFSGAIKARSGSADEVGVGPYGTGTGGIYFGNGTVALYNDANTQLKSLVGLSLGGNLTVSGTVNTFGTANGGTYITTPGTAASTGSLFIQGGNASGSTAGGGVVLYGGSHASAPGWVRVGLAGTSKFAVNTSGLGAGTDVFTVDQAGNLTVSGTGTSSFAGPLNVTASTLGTFASSTANATSGEQAFTIKGSNNSTSTNFASSRAPSLVLWNNSGAANSYAALVFQDGGGNAVAGVQGLFIDDATNHGALTFWSRAASGAYAEAGRFTGSGNLLIGTTTDSGNGKLQLATHTTSAGGIGFGTDISLYRSSANSLVFQATGSSKALLLYGDPNNSGILNGLLNYEGIYFTPSSHAAIIATNGTTALTIDSSQNATFAGKVTVSKANAGLDTSVTVNNTDSATNSTSSLILTSVAGSWTIQNNRSGGHLYFKDPATSATQLQINNSTGLATFAGSIAIGNTVQTAVSVASTHKVTISIGGVTYYLLATNV